MGLGGTLANALSGLKVTEAGLDVVSRNVANSSTAGYSKQKLNQSVVDYGGPAFGVRVGEVTRVLNEHLVSQLRGELTGMGYADTMQSYLERLEISFGAPGAGNGLESLYSKFESSLEGVVASPENPSTREEFVQNARLMASGLNSLSDDVQELRRQAESEIDGAVNRINEILKSIASANQKIAVSPVDDPQVLDQRDQLINELAEMMEVNVLPAAPDGTRSVLTRSGTLLVSDVPMTLTFENRQATVRADSLYEAGGLGTIKLSGPGRPPVDLIQEGAFASSGRIGALLELRDKTLVEAQNSLDALADSMARAMSGYDIGSSVATNAGNDVVSRTLNLTGDPLSYGDRISFTYRDATGEQTVTFIATDSTAGAIDDGATGGKDRVVGIDFTQDDATIKAAMEAAIPGNFTVNVAGGKSGSITFVDGNPGTNPAITGLTATATETSVTGQLALPLFTDGGQPYTGSFNGGSQQRGFAGSIRVNQAIIDDSKLLSQHAAGVPLGDPARAQAMIDRLQAVEIRTPNGKIVASDPATGAKIGTFVSRIISTQAARASAANHSQKAQSEVVQQLEERSTSKSQVSVDEEMARLLELQMAYQANAKVVKTFEEMLYKLMEIRP